MRGFYVVFYPPSLDSAWSIFGHVELFVEQQGLLIRMDSLRDGFEIVVWPGLAEGEAAIAARFGSAEVYKIAKPRRALGLPFWIPINCASMTAYQIGFRAFTPWGLKRILRKNGAEKLSDGKT